jgi:hypothetical protein
MTFPESKWLLSIVVPYQPHFADLPANTFTLWGYGLFIDERGDYISKPMAQCTGREILTELIRHFAESHHFGAARLRKAHGERSVRVEVLANSGANLPVRELVSSLQGAHP